MNREKLVRDAAYAIWESEGRPEGRDAIHWRMAEERVAKSHAAQGEPAKTTPKERGRKASADKQAAARTRAKKTI